MIDINPSVKITLDENYKVTSVKAMKILTLLKTIKLKVIGFFYIGELHYRCVIIEKEYELWTECYELYSILLIEDGCSLQFIVIQSLQQKVIYSV